MRYNPNMGLYERDYIHRYPSGPDQTGVQIRLPQTAVGWLILVNVAVWVADAFTSNHWLSDRMAITGQTLYRPWLWWQWITYGFAHSPVYFWHLLGNMLGLFFFGRDLEWRYGRAEFLRLYLTLVFLSGLGWSVSQVLFHPGVETMVYGASGAVTGIILLFALLYPHRMVLLFFVLPVPAWVLGVLLVVSNLLGSMNQSQSDVAYEVHLVGAAVAYGYYRFGWHLGGIVPGQWWYRLQGWASRRRLRLYRPPEEKDFLPEEPPHQGTVFLSEERLAEEVDRILAKISQLGEASLTPQERYTLEEASRQYQRRRRRTLHENDPSR